MRTSDIEADSVYSADRTIQRDLLGRLGRRHCETVSRSLGLPEKSSARQIAAASRDRRCLEDVLDKLSSTAYRLLVRGVFDSKGKALDLYSYQLDWDLFDSQHRTAAATELERHGLAFTFIARREIIYHIPADLRDRVRGAIAARLAKDVGRMEAPQWLTAWCQDLCDMADMWTTLARAPVPLTYDGEIKSRSKPRLLAALSALDLPDPDGALTQRRLDFALAQLRDNGYLQVNVEDGHGHCRTKQRLMATGDLVAGLGDNDIFTHLPDLEFTEENVVMCAQALRGALTGEAVSLVSFGEALLWLLDASDLCSYSEVEPERLALYGLFPQWLRGELEFGISHGNVTAIRFIYSKRHRTASRRILAERYQELWRSAGDIPIGEQPAEPELSRQCFWMTDRWDAYELHPLGDRYYYLGDELRDNSTVLISTLDASVTESHRSSSESITK